MAEHIVPRKVYYTIFGALLVLTGLTVFVARLDLEAAVGPRLGQTLATIIALTIAVTKATLVILYFMHVRYSPRLTWVVICSGLLWLVILIGLTLSDYLTRNLSALPGGR
ncbi:MAG: cytochrome C oxidase subunit IV family protein [Acidobacteriota bacterium]|nr:cytochrome C oxidase subunit IV family protein [Acidobacteriota bacterium]